jgi:uncharacterized protein (DUF362 family)
MGWDERLRGIRRVFVKPNLVSDVPQYIESGSNTEACVIEGVLRYLANFPVEVFLGESDSGTRLKGRKLWYALKHMGLFELQKRYSFKIVNMTYDELVPVSIPNAVVLKEIKLAKTLLDCDLVLSLPKIKTHKYATITCALKNLFGIIPDPLRVTYHRSLHGVVADLNSLFIGRHLVLTDGIRAMEGNGPLFGVPRELGILVISDDPLANDYVVTQVMGIPWTKVQHLVLFQERHAHMDLSSIILEDLANVLPCRQPFKPSRLNWFLRIEKYLLPQPWFLRVIYHDLTLRYLIYPVRGWIRKIRGGSATWYMHEEQPFIHQTVFEPPVRSVTD